MAEQENVVQTVLRVLGPVPRAFSAIVFLAVAAWITILTVSIYLTLFRDCGKVKLAGTFETGGHCTNYTHSEWRQVSLPDRLAEDSQDANNTGGFDDSPPIQIEASPNTQRKCVDTVIASMTNIPYKIRDAGDGRIPFRDVPREEQDKTLVRWYQLNDSGSIADLIFFCLPDRAIILATGNLQIDVATMADTARERLSNQLSGS
ncbi:MAG: hypothetical protein QNJ16_20255 [Rhodobacter sp.]|nr:hypothetical protein [Rhodobacter sp.]